MGFLSFGRGLRYGIAKSLYPMRASGFWNGINVSCHYSTGAGKPVRIGCASGFWGDTPTAVPQLVKKGELDYLVLDYLSEVTMSLLVGAQRKMPELGWCPDFVQDVGPFLPDIKKQGIRVVTNAGGVNPYSCMTTLQGLAKKMNVGDLSIAVINGDNVLSNKEIPLTQQQCPNPATVASANAYLGAGPISRALDLGADIIITGRCTDSALALGPLIHSFKWDPNNFDLMAKGSLAGHLIECGAQSTGGIFTDWEDISGWENNGFPIAVCEPSGDFLITKPDGTGGQISKGTVAEQLVYEIHDPASYILPDVICDFSQVRLEETERGVRVTGGSGRAPTPFYKVGGTYQDGWKCVAVCPIIGPKAREKGHKTAQAILKRCKGIFNILKMKDFQRVHVQMLGMEEGYGSYARKSSLESRDGVLWMSVHHSDKKALERFAKEIASAGTGMAPGFTTVISGRPKPSPLLNFFSYLVPKDQLQIQIETSTGHKETYEVAQLSQFSEVDEKPSLSSSDNDSSTQPNVSSGTNTYKLSDLAFLRSGDKGDTCNIGVVARSPEIYPILKRHLSSQLIQQYFQHKFPPGSDGSSLCDRYELPGINGLNFVLRNSLGGGGIASLTPDPQGKGYAQQLADLTLTNLPKLI